MTISSTTNRVSYQGNGTTAALSFPYAFLATTDLVVIETIIATGAQTTRVLATDYTVTGTPDASGNYPNGGSVVPNLAIAATLKWTIYRDPPATQTQIAVDNDPLPASLINSGFDKLTMLVQRVRDLVTRGARLSDGDVSGASVTLPMPVASSLLGWASDGLSIVNYVVANLTGSIVTAFSSTLLAAADQASWRSALGLSTFADTTAANTFTADQSITSIDAGATAGPTLTLKRNSASPAVSDIVGQVDFQSKDSGGGTDSTVRLRGVLVDPTAASEDGELHIQTIVAGTTADRVIVGQGVQVGSPTGGDKGLGTVNAAGLIYQNGARIGNIAQIVGNETGAVSTGSTTVPYDDTIPQLTEGVQFLSQAITPTSATSTLLLDVVLVLGASAAAVVSAAVFQDATANAIAAASTFTNGSGSPMTLSFRHRMAAGTTSATTFTVRVGGSAGETITFNGTGAARKFGGVSASSITITEILP